MKVSVFSKIILLSVLIVIFSGCVSDNSAAESTLSPYSGQELRGIKSLSQEDIESLQAGTGVAFGGMAKLAELNSYPGPRHVLDLQNELELTQEQKNQIQVIYEKMNTDAVSLGARILALELEMNNKFASKTINDSALKEMVDEIAQLYGELRYVHLASHLEMINILTPEQVIKYNELRGYSSGNSCENVPEGHDPEMWKLHNNCN